MSNTPRSLFIAELREPRQGIHEDGTEEMKTWDQLWEQCQRAAREIESLSELLRDAEREVRDAARGAADEARWQERQGEEYGSY